jgi:hypothetical protein
MQEQPSVIVEYTDKQALEDGVLVSVPGEGKVNRVTRAVFDHFTKPLGSTPRTGEVTDITPLQDAIRAIVEDRTRRRRVADQHLRREGALADSE